MVFFVSALLNIYRAASLFAHEQTAHSRGHSSGSRHWLPSPDQTIPVGVGMPGHIRQSGPQQHLALSEHCVVGPRACVFSSGKDGEVGNISFIVDTAGCSQADNSGCLDPTQAGTPADKGVQENKPLSDRFFRPSLWQCHCVIRVTDDTVDTDWVTADTLQSPLHSLCPYGRSTLSL